MGLINKKQPKLVILGLDNSGKTTLIYILQDDVMKYMVGTGPRRNYPEIITIESINTTFKVWDLGDLRCEYKKWSNYVSDIDAIIYMIDSSDKDRF